MGLKEDNYFLERREKEAICAQISHSFCVTEVLVTVCFLVPTLSWLRDIPIIKTSPQSFGRVAEY